MPHFEILYEYCNASLFQKTKLTDLSEFGRSLTICALV